MASAILPVAACSAILAWMSYAGVVRTDPPLLWDEGAHSLFAVSIATDIRRGDLAALAYDVYRQVYWPPLHSCLAGAAVLWFGERTAVVRSVSTLAYLLLPIALVASARIMHARADARRGWTAAAIAGLLAVAIPAFITYASSALLELTALLSLVATLLAAFWAERAPDRPGRRTLVALGLLATFFLKTNYGLLLIAAIALDMVIEARWSGRPLMSRRNACVVIPVAVVLAIWFAYPPKILITVRAMFNKPLGADPWTLEGLAFYPRALLAFAGSWPMLAVLLGGFAAAWPARRLPDVRLLLIVAILQFLLAEAHHTKLPRHLLPIVPPLILLAAAAGAGLVEGRGSGGRSRRAWYAVAAGGLFAILIGVHLFALVSHPLPTVWGDPGGGALGSDYLELSSAVDGALERGDRVLLVGTFDLAPPVMDWDLVVNRRRLAVEESGAIGIVDRNRRAAAAIRAAPLPSWLSTSVLRAVERYDGPGKLRTLYAGLPEWMAPSAFARSMGETVARGRIDTVILAVSTRADATYPPAYFDAALATIPLAPVSSRRVAGEWAMRVDEYRVLKTAPPAHKRPP
jgi:hypothetical protein